MESAQRTDQQKPPAVILGGAANAVSVARSLGAAGVDVHAIGTDRSAVRYSRHCSHFVDLGGEGDVQARWLEWLAGGPAGAVLLACDDDALELVARNRMQLVGMGYRPFEADDETVLAMLDKDRTYALARQIGVPVPRTSTVRDLDDLEEVLESASYPCVLKPLHGHVFRARLGTSAKVVHAHSPSELRESLWGLLALDLQMMVIENIPGPNERYCSFYTYLDEHGEPLFQFTKRKLRGYPLRYGTWCYEVTDWLPEVAELGLRFLQGAGLRGAAHVEFKRDPRDDRLKLIECNARFTASNEVLQVSGIDLALLSYERAAGRHGPSLDGYRSGVRLWNPMADARALLAHRRRGELTLLGWLRSLLHRQHFSVFRLDDPMPTLGYHAREVVRLIKAWVAPSEPERPRPVASGPAERVEARA